MSDERYAFTTNSKSVTGDAEVAWGDDGWGGDIESSESVAVEDGVVRPRTATTLTWETRDDWDGARSRKRVVTRDVGVNDPDRIALGYDPQYLPGSSDLVGYWSFDETSGSTLAEAVDGWDATTAGSPDLGRTGVLGTNAVYFGPGGNGGAYAKAPLPTYDQFTVTAVGRPIGGDGTGNTGWIQAQPGQSGVSTDGADKSIGIWGGSEDTAIWGRIVDSSGAQNFPENRTLTQGEWHVVTMTADGSTGRLYANGDEVSTVSYDGTVRSYDEVAFGRQHDESFGGEISAVLFWNSALSQSQVQQLSTTLQSGSLTTGVKRR